MSKRRRRRKKKPGPADGARGGRSAAEEEKSGQQEASERKQKKDKKKKSPARNFVETIVVVAVLVLVLRGFLLEAFKIPSSSMEPTLLGHPYHGDRVLALKPSVKLGSPGRWSVVVFLKRPDRLERERGETTDRNFIKRVVGLPGDRLLLAGGDVFARGRGAEDYAIVRKPASVQKEVWLPVYESRFDRDRQDLPPWKLDEGLAHDPEKGSIASSSEGTAWARFAANHYEGDDGLVTNLYLRDSRLKVTCPHCLSSGRTVEFQADFSTSRTRARCRNGDCARELDVLRDDLLAEAVARFECPSCHRQVSGRREDIASGCPHCSLPLPGSLVARATSAPGRYPSSRDEEAAVADIRVSFDVRASGGRGCVLAEISVDEEHHEARVPLGGGTASISGPAPVGTVESEVPVAPFLSARNATGAEKNSPASVHRVSFAKVDQALVLAIDGEELIRKEFDVDWSKRAGRPGSNSVRIGIKGAGAALEHVRIDRDLHYLSKGNPELFESYSAARGRWLSEPRAGESDAIRMRKELGASQFVMLGDNSPSSYDGRMWPPVEKGDMVGRAFFLFWPPARMRWVR